MVSIDALQCSTLSYFSPIQGAELVDTITVGFTELRLDFRFSHYHLGGSEEAERTLRCSPGISNYPLSRGWYWCWPWKPASI